MRYKITIVKGHDMEMLCSKPLPLLSSSRAEDLSCKEKRVKR